MECDVLVIGAGPAGLMAAGQAAARGLAVTVLEKNKITGKKLRITGKGRCNVTNACARIDELMENVPRGGRFLYGAFSRCMPSDVIELFEGLGVPLKIERGNRVFPVSDKAADIAEALARWARDRGAAIRTGVEVSALLLKDGAVRGVKTADGAVCGAKAVIVATGGLSYPLTGSTGDGYRFAKAAGHTVTPLRPSLVGLTLDAPLWRQAQGLTVKNAAVTVCEGPAMKEVFSDFGELLFTHFGVSGPVVLSASAHLEAPESGRYTLVIDLKPALDEKKLDARLLREIAAAPAKQPAGLLRTLLPASLVPVFMRLWGADPAMQVNKVTREQRQELVYLLKHLEAPVTGTRPVEEAIVTSGGVNLKELNPKTMESKLCRGLYFAGEVLDADAYTGGFNLQIAFATGAAAGAGAAVAAAAQ